MGNPLLETSESRQFAAKVYLVAAVFFFVVSLYGPVPGDLSIVLFVLSPVLGGFVGFGAWYYHTYHVE